MISAAFFKIFQRAAFSPSAAPRRRAARRGGFRSWRWGTSGDARHHL